MAFTKISQHPYPRGVVVLVEDTVSGEVYVLRKYGHPHGSPVLQVWWEAAATAKAAQDTSTAAFNQAVKDAISDAVTTRVKFDAWCDTLFPLRKQPQIRAGMRALQRHIQEDVETV